MSQRPQQSHPESGNPASGVTEQAAPPRLDRLPLYRVILHNDDVNDCVYVVETLCELTPVNPGRAVNIMREAHTTGAALILTTHRERAELYVEQFRSKRLTVTMEPEV